MQCVAGTVACVKLQAERAGARERQQRGATPERGAIEHVLRHRDLAEIEIDRPLRATCSVLRLGSSAWRAPALLTARRRAPPRVPDDAALLAADALDGAASELPPFIGPAPALHGADALDIEALQRDDEPTRSTDPQRRPKRALAERAAARAETAELLQQPADEGLEAWRAERERWLAEQLAAASTARRRRSGDADAVAAADADAAADGATADDVFLTAGGRRRRGVGRAGGARRSARRRRVARVAAQARARRAPR